MICTLTGDAGGNAVAASAQVTVTPDDVEIVSVPGGPAPTPPGFSKSFGLDPTTAGGTSSLTFTIDNTANGTATTDLDFIDDLPAGVTVAPTPNAATDCTGGTLTAVADTGRVSYTGGTVGAGASCTVEANVTSPTMGLYVNTSGDLTSSAGNSGPATDTLNVTPATSLRFTKEFTDDPVAADSVTLEFTLDNLDPGSAVQGLSFSDDLEAVIPGLAAVGLPASDVCGQGSVITGTSLLQFTDASLPPGGTCTFSVTLEVPANAAVGTFLNETSDLFVGGLFGASPATDTLVVDPAPPPNTVDGIYGPGVFMLGTDTCDPPFFGSSFNGTVTISENGTRLEIDESEVRVSTGTIVNGVGVFSGSGFVGQQPASWMVDLVFDAQGRLVVTETITLTQRACAGDYGSEGLNH